MDAHAWDQRYAAVDRVWSSGPNQFVAETLNGLPPGDALDLACGEGRNALWLAGRGWRVTAIDFSQVAVERGRRLADAAGVEVDWRVEDVLTADLPATDLVVLAYLQLPADQRRLAVRRAWAGLRAGGTFLLVAHDTTNLTEGTGGPQDAAVLYSAADVLADVRADVHTEAGTEAGTGDGVEVRRAERVARVVTAEDGHGGMEERVAWDVLVHLERR